MPNQLSHTGQGRTLVLLLLLLLFLKIYLFIFRERGREEEGEEEKHQCVVVSHIPLTGDPACNPGMGPARESNQPPFVSQAGT